MIYFSNLILVVYYFEGYLVNGVFSYSGRYTCDGIEGIYIVDIFTPEGKLVAISDLHFRFIELLKDELVIIGKIKKIAS